MRALVITWAPGGNLPPMVAAAGLLAARGHDVEVLGSAATRPAFEAGRFAVHPYRRAPEQLTQIAFEAHAESMLAIAAGADIALDVRDLFADEHHDLAVVDFACCRPRYPEFGRLAFRSLRSCTSCTAQSGSSC